MEDMATFRTLIVRFKINSLLIHFYTTPQYIKT